MAWKPQSRLGILARSLPNAHAVDARRADEGGGSDDEARDGDFVGPFACEKLVAEVVAQIAVLQVLAPEVVLRILALVYLVHRVPVVVPAALWVFVV